MVQYRTLTERRKRKIAEYFKLSERTFKKAKEYEEIIKKSLPTISPQVRFATALWLACSLYQKRSGEKIANVVGCSTVALFKCHKKLKGAGLI